MDLLSSTKVKISAFTKINWPMFCVLCLKPATKEGFQEIGGGRVPYCENCHEKVERLDRWKDNLFMISLIFGAISVVLYFVGLVVSGEARQLLRGQTYIIAITAGLLWVAIMYGLLWILLLPLRAIFHKKLAAPGVKILNSKEPGTMILKFSNPEYADTFRRVN